MVVWRTTSVCAVPWRRCSRTTTPGTWCSAWGIAKARKVVFIVVTASTGPDPRRRLASSIPAIGQVLRAFNDIQIDRHFLETKELLAAGLERWASDIRIRRKAAGDTTGDDLEALQDRAQRAALMHIPTSWSLDAATVARIHVAVKTLQAESASFQQLMRDLRARPRASEVAPSWDHRFRMHLQWQSPVPAIGALTDAIPTAPVASPVVQCQSNLSEKRRRAGRAPPRPVPADVAQAGSAVRVDAPVSRVRRQGGSSACRQRSRQQTGCSHAASPPSASRIGCPGRHLELVDADAGAVAELACLEAARPLRCADRRIAAL
jgi:hypothetical protein